ncbi:MAG: hypothetical protein A2Z52_02485 [Candidatus Moranbacteria bacterium RBG_19FT_COMBO_42_6]|nr:MAG: hypothetical protein A2Z52_02485 [Candidatus Moranbacteria bacterium RBG_19FT_COMBO_42_6]
MAEKNKVQEAETEAPVSPEEKGELKKRKISSELLIILIIGFLFGIAIKTEVAKRVNVVDSTFYGKQGYNFVEMQNRQNAQNQEQAPVPEPAPDQVQP